MLRLLGPKLLILGLALPGASLALGLGDVHVESALHQPLAAKIDILSPTPDELATLSATMATQEIFQRYGLERPSFLATTALMVGKDKDGRPILVLRSTEAFTEPAVTFLVDVHFLNGELIREYTVLLDPPGLAPLHSDPESLSAPPMPASTAVASKIIPVPERVVTNSNIKPAGSVYTVASRDTLDRIAGIAGAHSRSDRHRMMIAIFRANPGAFQTNINFLHSGATLRFPSAAELSAISAEEANREFVAQMAVARASVHHHPATLAVAAKPVADARPAEFNRADDPAPAAANVAPAPSIIVAANPAPAPSNITEPQDADEPMPARPHGPPHGRSHGMQFAWLAVGLGLAVAAAAWIHLRRRRDDDDPAEPRQELDSCIRSDMDDARAVKPALASPPFPKAALDAAPLVSELSSKAVQASASVSPSESNWFKDAGKTVRSEPLPAETTVKLAAPQIYDGEATVVLPPDNEVGDDTAARAFAFFNPEGSVNGTHVVISGGLREESGFVERRRNPADVLRHAIEREPHRSDLRLKLLELYYTAAAQNQQAFLEVTRQLAKNEKLASAKDWAQIADMGRAIAPNDELFRAEGKGDKAVA